MGNQRWGGGGRGVGHPTELMSLKELDCKTISFKSVLLSSVGSEPLMKCVPNTQMVMVELMI